MDTKKELKILLWIIVTFTVRNSPYIPFLNMIFNKNKLLLKCGFVQIKYYLCPDIIFRLKEMAKVGYIYKANRYDSFEAEKGNRRNRVKLKSDFQIHLNLHHE